MKTANLFFALSLCITGMSVTTIAAANNAIAYHNGLVSAIVQHPHGNIASLRYAEEDENGRWRWSNYDARYTDKACANSDMHAIKFLANEFFTVGDGGVICHSTDGKGISEAGAWKAYQTPSAYELHDIAVSPLSDTLVAVGDSGTILYAKKMPIIGLGEWQTAWVSTHLGSFPHHLNSVTYGNWRFVAVGNDATIFYSDNGVNWKEVPLPASDNANFTKVIYQQAANNGKGLFITTAQDATIWSSADGKTWAAGAGLSALPEITFVDVCYGKDENGQPLLIAVGGDQIATSDGVADAETGQLTWRTHAMPRTHKLTSIIYTSNHFVLSMERDDEGLILFSVNGKDWAEGTINNQIEPPMDAIAGLIATKNNLIAIPHGDGSENAPSIALRTTTPDKETDTKDPHHWVSMGQAW